MELFFRKYGDIGIPLIIIHGLYGSGDNWVNIARELSGSFEVYVIDQRNHGQSPHSDTFNYFALVDDLFELINDHQLINPILINMNL